MGQWNRGFDYRERLGAVGPGCTLLGYLAGRYRHTTTPDWRHRIESGQVLLDGQVVGPDTVVRSGQEVLWRRPPWVEPAAPLEFEVLLEDAALVAVAKPAGLPTLPGAGFLDSTLLGRVRERIPGATPIHRLGRWTSGVVLFARTPEARTNLTRQWAERRVLKLYRALASGNPAWDEHDVDRPIGPVPHALLGSVYGAARDGKAAHSTFRVVERRGETFLCHVAITTGRPHQIRIHLAAAGHPLAGDPLYGPGGVPRPGCSALPGDPGYLLHASELEFRHPTTSGRTVVRCPPPRELRCRPGPGSGA